MRDDFPRPVIEMLAKRVGLRCSNPSCRQLTSGPHTDQMKALNVGVAGHVTAAAPGGPRYDESLTPEQRMSIDNGIWLCQFCGKLVDNDVIRYPATLLRRWREQAEQAALKEIESGSVTSRQSGDGHSIRFAVDDWRLWRERGNLPGDGMVFIRGWKRGDIRYSCTIRLRNDLDWEEQLHRLLVEFKNGETILLSDKYAFDEKPLALPPRKWISLEVCHGLHDKSFYERADSVWFSAETLGDNFKHKWQMAAVAQKPQELDEA
jgi:hypothetical protein